MPRGRNTRNSVQEIHIAILGMNHSGKSAVTVKYITRRFISEYDPNLEDTYCKHESFDGQEYMIWIMDTVEGKEKSPSRWVSWADVYLVVYDITSQMSFQYAENLLKLINQHEHSLCVRQHVVCLVGNKFDMERYRQVNRSDGQRMADEYGAQFAEMATTREYSCVKTVFHKAITAAIGQRTRVADRSPSPRMYSSDSEVTGTGLRSKNAMKTSPRTVAFRRSKSPKSRVSFNKMSLPPVAPNGKGKGGPGSKLLKLFQN